MKGEIRLQPGYSAVWYRNNISTIEMTPAVVPVFFSAGRRWASRTPFSHLSLIIVKLFAPDHAGVFAFEFSYVLHFAASAELV
jgi:hypothetical protein